MELKNKYMLITFLSVLIIICISSTVAIYEWTSSTNTNLSLSIEGLDAYINYQKGTDVLTGTLSPGSDYKTGISTEIELWKNPELTTDVFATIYLDITTIGENMKNELGLKWAIESNNVLLAEGNFLGQEEGNSITLKDGINLKTEKQTFIIYIWLDEKINISQEIKGETLSTKVRAAAINSYYKDPSGANAPALMSGMVPVEYLTTSDGVAQDGWYVADQTTDWYSYGEQRWANAVLVTEESGLRKAVSGTYVSEDDVLAYYVWIPRYKYQLFNASKTIGNDSYDAQNKGINVLFEEGIATTGNVNCSISLTGVETCTNAVDGNWYTHPAFWWDINDNSVRETNEELSGIWVGKFDLSSSNPSAEYGGGSTTNLSVRVKPNVYIWRNNSISNFFTVIQNMMKDGNEYGINNEETDSHMLKNIEWGASAYLSHSKYGRCSGEICVKVETNDSFEYITGEGNYIENVRQSTTGNVTGIYDMSGTFKAVMANMIYSDGKNMISGRTDTLNSGFKGMLYNDGVYKLKEEGYDYPARRYYDVYSYNTDRYDFSRSHLGDATVEILLDSRYFWQSGWNGGFFYGYNPWMYRCYLSEGSNNETSLFIFGVTGGNGYSTDTTRATLVALP